MQSGLSPAFRPLVLVALAQYFNLLKPLKRLDSDGQPFLSTPYKLRHGSESVQVALDTMPMIGQLVTSVPAQVYQESYQRCGPRGVEAIFVGFVEENGIIKNVAKLIPLVDWQRIRATHLHQGLETTPFRKSIPIG